MADPTPFNAVYHIAALNHWRDVVREQYSLLLANKNLHQLHVSIACQDDSEQGAVLKLLEEISADSGRAIELRWYRSRLQDFEHMAMILVDTVVREQQLSVLYFHGKGVSYSPPSRNMEIFRMHGNQIVREADQWAAFLGGNEADACGPLLIEDRQSKARFFGGNFWMAKAAYLRGLPPYQEFAAQPRFGHSAWSRYLAESAINREGRMRAFAIDGTALNEKTFVAYMTARYGPDPAAGAGLKRRLPASFIRVPKSAAPSQPSSESPPAPPHP